MNHGGPTQDKRSERSPVHPFPTISSILSTVTGSFNGASSASFAVSMRFCARRPFVSGEGRENGFSKLETLDRGQEFIRPILPPSLPSSVHTAGGDPSPGLRVNAVFITSFPM